MGVSALLSSCESSGCMAAGWEVPEIYGNLPDLQTQFLHVLHLREGTSRQVDEPVQLRVHLQHPLPAVTVAGLHVVAMARDERSHPLGGTLDISDVLGPEGGAGMAWRAGREEGVVPRGALVTEDPRDADSTQTLAGVGVARRPLRPLQVTVTSYETGNELMRFRQLLRMQVLK